MYRTKEANFPKSIFLCACPRLHPMNASDWRQPPKSWAWVYALPSHHSSMAIDFISNFNSNSCWTALISLRIISSDITLHSWCRSALRPYHSATNELTIVVIARTWKASLLAYIVVKVVFLGDHGNQLVAQNKGDDDSRNAPWQAETSWGEKVKPRKPAWNQAFLWLSICGCQVRNKNFCK